MTHKDIIVDVIHWVTFQISTLRTSLKFFRTKELEIQVEILPKFPWKYMLANIFNNCLILPLSQNKYQGRVKVNVKRNANLG